MAGKPKPTVLKAIEGNRGKRPLPKNEPKPKPVRPKYPPHVTRSGKRVWRRLASILVANKLLTEIDGDNFGSMCNVIAKLEEISELKKDPEFKLMYAWLQCDPGGNEKPMVKVNPIIVEERMLHNQLRIYAAEFGMTPRGRAGLSIGSGSEKDGMEDLLD